MVHPESTGDLSQYFYIKAKLKVGEDISSDICIPEYIHVIGYSLCTVFLSLSFWFVADIPKDLLLFCLCLIFACLYIPSNAKGKVEILIEIAGEPWFFRSIRTDIFFEIICRLF